MAKVTFTSIVAGLSGKIAGHVYARNRSGAYVRNQPGTIVNPGSPRQLLMREALAEQVRRWWDDLDDAERLGWNVWANSLPIDPLQGRPSGQNMYVKWRLAMIGIGVDVAALGTTPPELGVLLPGADPLFTAAYDVVTGLTVTYDDSAQPWGSEDGAYLILSMGTPQSPGITFFNGPFKANFSMKVEGDSVAPPASPQVIAPANLPFVLAEGQKIWTRYRISRANETVSGWFKVGPAIVTP